MAFRPERSWIVSLGTVEIVGAMTTSPIESIQNSGNENSAYVFSIFEDKGNVSVYTLLYYELINCSIR